MKIRKKFLGIIFALVLGLCILPAVSVSASQRTDAMKAFKKMLSADTITWKDKFKNNVTKISTKDLKFAIAYIDNNSVPELVVLQNTYYASAHNTGQMAVYRYKNGKVQHSTTLCALNAYYPGKFVYYKKKGIVISNGFNHGDIFYYVKIPAKDYRLWKYDCRIEKAYNVRTNKYSYFSYSTTGNYKQISSSTFKSKLQSLVGSTKATSAPFKKNNKTNRDTYLK